MKAIPICTCFLFLIGNEILSALAILILAVTFLCKIIDERVNR